jgi:hypothetical protein
MAVKVTVVLEDNSEAALAYLAKQSGMDLPTYIQMQVEQRIVIPALSACRKSCTIDIDRAFTNVPYQKQYDVRDKILEIIKEASQ